MNTRILIWEVEKTIQTCKSLVCNKLWYTLIIFPQAKQQYCNNKKNYCVCAAAWEFILPAAWYIITVVVCTLALLWCMLIKYSCQPNNTYIIWSNHYGTTTATALHACCIDYRIFLYFCLVNHWCIPFWCMYGDGYPYQPNNMKQQHQEELTSLLCGNLLCSNCLVNPCCIMFWHTHADSTHANQTIMNLQQ